MKQVFVYMRNRIAAQIPPRRLRRQGRKTMRDNIKIQQLAERIYNYVDPWDRDYETVDDIANDIKNDPETVVEYLLDILEA